MNAQELSNHIKAACRAFDLQFHEANFIEMEFSFNAVTFKYENQKLTIKTEK